MSPSQPTSDTLDLRRFFRSVSHLRWIYLASFIFFMSLAAIYWSMRQPKYEIYSTILIEDPSGDNAGAAGGMMTMMRTFSVGGFGATSVNNELQLINSHDVLLNTAKILGLNRTYTLRDGMSRQMLYLDSPIAVEASREMLDTLSAGMKITVDIKGDKADIEVTRGRFKRLIAAKENVTLPATIDTPYGPLHIMPTAHFTPEPKTIVVDLGSYEDAADFLTTDIDVSLPDKLADAVSFQMLYPNRDRGRAILNTIMAQYCAKRLERKHATASAQLEFLDGRINSIFGELSEAEQKLQDFKTAHKLVNIGAEAPLLLESSYSGHTEMVKTTAEIDYLREVLAALTNPARGNELLPVFDSQAYPMIKDYNTMLMEKKELERSATPSNPVMDTAEANLAEMRTSVTRNVESMLQAAETLLASQKALVAKADAKLNTIPGVERDYTLLARDRNLKNELYTYLAAQRENTALQLYNQETPGFIIDEAYTSVKPSNKKAYLLIIICFLLAVICPTCLAIWLTWRHRRVTATIDAASAGIESTTVTVDGSRKSINTLRSLIMERSGNGPTTVYVSGDAAGQVIAALREAYGAIGLNSDLLTPSQLNLESDNDSLYVETFRRREAEILGAAPTTLLIEVPNPDRIDELKPLIESRDPRRPILLLAYRSGSLPIARLRKTAALFGPSSIILAIVKD